MKTLDELKLNTLGGLPTEIIINLLSFLDEKSLLWLKHVCKRFYSIIDDQLDREMRSEFEALLKGEEIKKDTVVLKKVAPNLYDLKGLQIFGERYSKKKSNIFVNLADKEHSELLELRKNIDAQLKQLAATAGIEDLAAFKRTLETHIVIPSPGEAFKLHSKLSKTAIIALIVFIIYNPIAIPKIIQLVNQMNTEAAAAWTSAAWSNEYVNGQPTIPDGCTAQNNSTWAEEAYEICQTNLNAYSKHQGLLCAWLIPDVVYTAVVIGLMVALVIKIMNFQQPTYQQYPVKLLKKEHAKLWREIQTKYREFLRGVPLNTVQDIINFINQHLANTSQTENDLLAKGEELLTLLDEFMITIEQNLELGIKNYSPYSQGEHSKIEFYNKVSLFFSESNKHLREKKASQENKIDVKPRVQEIRADEVKVDVGAGVGSIDENTQLTDGSTKGYGAIN